MHSRVLAAGLGDIADKLARGGRLTLDEGVRLFECPDLLAVGALANREREKRHGARTFYNYNLRLEPTDVCEASCLFCSFARLKEGQPGAYTMSLEQAWEKLRERGDQPVTFQRRELDQLLRLYGRMVADNEWRDYAIDHLPGRAVFSVFRRTSETPLFRIVKDPGLARRQGTWSVVSATGLVLKRGHELARVLGLFDRRLRLVEA